jgi:RND family efflux transporter MFP subunit
VGVRLTEKPVVVKTPHAARIADPQRDYRKAVAKLPRKPSRRWPWFVAAAAVVGIGAGVLLAKVMSVGERSSGENGAVSDSQPRGRASLGFVPADGAESKDPSSASRFATVPVEVVRQSGTLRLTGSLVADEKSSVASHTSGIAAEVFVDRGSIVRKGDVLVQIDPTDAKNNLAEGQSLIEEIKARLGLGDDLSKFNPEDEPEVRLAKAAVDLTALNLKRADEMNSQKVISAEAYDQTRTEHELATQRYRQALLQIKQVYQSYQTAMTKLAILEKAVADTTIRAPFDGWVAERLVSVGEQISAGMQATKVVTLVRIDPLRLSLTVPQQDIGRIEPGQTVRFYVDSFPDRVFQGTVRFIAPIVASETRSMIVEAIVPNPKAELRPGLFATADVELKRQEQGLFVPVSAVQRAGEVAQVFVVRDGVARQQVVALGAEGKGKVLILAGLTGKETLVAHPELVRDGDAIRP